MKNFSKNIILWIVIGILLIALFNLFQNSSSTNQSKEISFSDFLIAADNGNISEVKIVGNNVSGFFEDGRSFSTYSPNYPDLVDKLNQSGVKIIAEPAERSMHPILSVLLVMVSNALINWSLDFLYEANAIWWWKGNGFW